MGRNVAELDVLFTDDHLVHQNIWPEDEYIIGYILPLNYADQKKLHKVRVFHICSYIGWDPLSLCLNITRVICIRK